tara:strand:+ start:68 stop:532 length:465 start_codon:yes stop_codon:yes gene_type:complete
MINSAIENPFMLMAIEKAIEAYKIGEVPVGAVLVNNQGEVIDASKNSVFLNNDPTAHAEILAIRNGSKRLKSSRLDSCDLYVTLEPCPMCFHAISLARIRRVYFGAYDTDKYKKENLLNAKSNKRNYYYPEVISGLNEKICSDLLKNFFHKLRV